MSKAQRQTITLLSVISGALNIVITQASNDIDIKRVMGTKKFCDTLIKVYPHHGKEKKLQNCIKQRMYLYDKALSDVPEITYKPIMLVSMCSHILVDLLDRVKDKSKRSLLEPLQESITFIQNDIDPEKIYYNEYVEADKLLCILYNLIEY